MCEYCGCQAVAAIDELTREHDRALDHVREAEQAAAAFDLDRARTACDQLRAILGPHTAVEEQGLFPALAADFRAKLEVLEAEHRRIESVIDELRDPRPTWQTELCDAMSMLRTHILKEQDGVFPAALATLTVADWQTVDGVRTSVGSALAGTS